MDNSIRALRISIIVQWLLIAASIAAGMYEERNLPEVLRNYLNEQAGKTLSPGELAVLFIGVSLAIGLITSSIGIYRFIPRARTVYVVCSVGAILFLFMGPVITSPIEGTFKYLGDAADGFTIALLYFSPARVKFERSSQVS
jgi:hypothetical protein